MDGLLIVTVEGSHTPGALCRVVRETPARLYVEILDSGWSLPDMHAAIGGRGHARYVDRRDVLAVGITRAQYAAYKARHKVFEEARMELQRQHDTLSAAYEVDAGQILGIQKEAPNA